MIYAMYNPDGGGRLALIADDAERDRLREIRGPVSEDGSTQRPYIEIEHEALDDMIANSELDWIRPEEIGALTSAPILGIRRCEDDAPVEQVVAAWGFMDYALRSFVDDLIDTGKAVFQSGS